ncbi:hypothetical protein FRB99_007613 [Tulasnella sp. 403]|nr:hypothetical protein FRB99_007613 [Tulasnella sp. 403]
MVSAASPQEQTLQDTPFHPSLHLYPLNDAFVAKRISLVPENGKVKIGRQTSALNVPTEQNGYFDCKSLSRQHAEVWGEGGKIYIKDTKSPNGTYINGERLSSEGFVSEPFELRTDDVLELGITITDDSDRVMHSKVVAKVKTVLTPDDLAMEGSLRPHL